MKDIKTNFHTHVQRCRHAGGTEEEYVQAAISLGFTQLGFPTMRLSPTRTSACGCLFVSCRNTWIR